MDRYAILKNGQCRMIADTIEAAIMLVRSLETGLDRNNYHSPFTIVKESSLTKAQLDSVSAHLWN